MRCSVCQADLLPCEAGCSDGWVPANPLAVGSYEVEAEHECPEGCDRGWQQCWVCSYSEAAVMASAGQA